MIFSGIGKFFSQDNSHSIKIFYISENNIELDGFANLLRLKDSSSVSFAFIENSAVEFQGITDSTILIKTNIDGYDESYDLILLNRDSIYTIKLRKSKIIDEVVISAKQSLVSTSDNGSKVINVTNTTMASSNSVIDLIRLFPGISVVGNRVNLLGKGEVSFFIDNMKVTFEQFSVFPVNQVKNIEVISNPTARYDSEGKAVLKINTKSRVTKGLDILLYNSSTVNSLFFNQSRISSIYSKKKLSLKLELTNENGTTKTNSFSDRVISSDQNAWKYKFQDEEFTKNPLSLKYLAGIQYNINQKNQLNIEYYGGYQNQDLKIFTNNAIQKNHDSSFTILTRDVGEVKLSNNNYLFNFKRMLDTLGSNLFVGFQASDYLNQSTYLINEERTFYSSNESYNHLNKSRNTIKILAPQIDVIKYFKDSSYLEIGTKYSGVECRSVIDFSTSYSGDVFVPKPTLSNDFTYSESTVSGYFNYSRKLGSKWRGIGGFRNEYTSIYGKSLVTNSTVLNKNYNKVYPFLQLNCYVKRINIKVTLSRRINRPRYQDLDPFFWYQDSLTWVKGNPQLNPEITNSIDFVCSRKKIEIGLTYLYNQNPIRFIVQNNAQQNGAVIITQNNLHSSSTIQGAFQASLSHKFYSGVVNATGFLTQYNDSYLSSSLIKPTPGFMFYALNSLKFKRSYYCDIIINYTSTYADRLTMNRSYGSFYVALGRKFLNNKLDVQIIYNDAFGTYRIYQLIDNTSVSNTYRQYLNTRYIKVSLSYKIGLFKSASYNNKSILKDEINRI